MLLDYLNYKIRTDLTSIWKKASLKTIGKIQIETIVGRLIEKYETIRRSHNSKTINNKERNYAIELNQLLDISACPCFKPNSTRKSIHLLSQRIAYVKTRYTETE